MTILVVDDERPMLAVARRFLESEGYYVHVADSPQSAIAIANQVHVDLLLTDVRMPDMNGRQLFEVLSQNCPALRVLFMSGDTGNVLADWDMSRGGLIDKPFTGDELLHAVGVALDRMQSN